MTAARYAVANGARGLWGPRTVFIRASPVPVSFGERRAVLHALKKYCKIEYFKNLKNPDAFLSMTTSDEDAKMLISHSPITYRISNQEGAADSDVLDRLRTTVEPPHEAPDTIEQRAQLEQGQEQEQKQKPQQKRPTNGEDGSEPDSHGNDKNFVLQIFPKSTALSLSDMIEFNPRYGPWRKSVDATSFVAKTLRQSIPYPVMRDGLADWEDVGDGTKTAGGGVAGYRSGAGAPPTGRAMTPPTTKMDRDFYIQRRLERREARRRAEATVAPSAAQQKDMPGRKPRTSEKKEETNSAGTQIAWGQRTGAK